MTDSRQHPNNIRKPAKSKPAPLTPEEQAKVIAAREAAVAEQKAEQERMQIFNANVEGMSHRALVKAIDRIIKSERVKTGPKSYTYNSGPVPIIGPVILAVLKNTKTPTNVFETDRDGRPTRVARLDQMNLLGCPMVARG